MAVTVDDLPAHGPLPPGITRLGIVNAHMDAFRAHGIIEAFGFVNANKLARNADGGTALDAWRSAGHPLGNQTFSHMNIARSHAGGMAGRGGSGRTGRGRAHAGPGLAFDEI